MARKWAIARAQLSRHFHLKLLADPPVLLKRKPLYVGLQDHHQHKQRRREAELEAFLHE